MEETLLAPPKTRRPSAPAAPTPWQNRIVGYGDAPIGSLVPHPANWRLHPPAQRAALSGLVGDIGLIATVVVGQRTGPSEVWLYPSVEAEARGWAAAMSGEFRIKSRNGRGERSSAHTFQHIVWIDAGTTPLRLVRSA